MNEKCPFCEKEIRHDDRVGYQVVGYEYPRSQGGTNALRLRRRTGNVAHRECIEKQGQEPLFDD